MVKYVILIFFILPCLTNAQRPGNPGGDQPRITGSVSGRLIDTITRAPIEYAAVGLIDALTDKVVNGMITDEKGEFRISELRPGEYNLQISFMGYAARVIPGIRITLSKPDYAAGIIELTPESKLLEEIRISGEAALIESRPDKIIYNAERDITSAGGDASDVLRKVPLLTIDFDGNVSLRGSENVRILINGRPSGIFNASVADALKMMPADQIKSVEVITSPSAKYDGEGTAGIINIITKKKTIEGLAGSVELTGGTRSNRGNVNMNYGKGRLGLNASGGGHYSWPAEGTTTFRREEFGNATPSLLTQDGFNTSSRLGYRFNAGAEYNINGFSTLTSSLSLRGHYTDNLNDV